MATQLPEARRTSSRPRPASGTGNPANTARNWPNGIRIGAVSAAPNPAIVAAATTGSARTLAGIATRLTVPEIAAITGAVTR